MYPQWYDLAQVVDVQTKKAANLSIERRGSRREGSLPDVGVSIGLHLTGLGFERCAAFLVDPANGLGAHKLRRQPVVDAFEVWARRRGGHSGPHA